MTTQKISNSRPYNEGSLVTSANELGGYNRRGSAIAPTPKSPRTHIYGQENPKFAIISATNASPVVVPAIPGRRIKVLSYVIVSTTAQNAKWQSSTTDISGNMSLELNGGVAIDDAKGLVETAVGESLRLLPSGAGTVSGHLTYVVQ